MPPMPRAKPLLSGLSSAAERMVEVAENFDITEARDARDLDPRIRFALREIVHDFYDGFLSVEDRTKLAKDGELPKVRVPPPAVELSGELAVLLPAFRREERIVEFPVWLTDRDCLPGWVSLAHEAAGHAILDAFRLEARLRRQVTSALGESEAALWKGWFAEASSDCLATLNLGPAMALGALASWRAVGRLTHWQEKSRIPCAAFELGNEHPPPVVRAYLVAHATSLLSFPGAEEFGNALKRNIKAELTACKCSRRRLRAAEIFAETILGEPQRALNDFRFLDLQDWKRRDEELVAELRKTLRATRLPKAFENGDFGGLYAAHAVSAAIQEQLSGNGRGADADRVFHNLLELLVLMYESSRSRRTRRELRIR